MGRVVVTGAAGHIGGVLVRELLDRGVRPRVTVRNDRRALEGLDLEIVPADVRDGASLHAAFEGAELVFHLAAHISIDPAEAAATRAVNVDGTRAVVEACLRGGVRRLVHFSSIHALSAEPRDQPVDETRALCDGGHAPHYDQSKALAEREVLTGVARGLDAVILNPTGVIGPLDFRPSHMGEVLLRLWRRTLPGLVAGSFDWVDVRDVARSALAASERGARGERYVLSGHRASMREIASLAQHATGVPAPRFVAPMWLARAGVPFASGYDRLRGRRPLFTSDALRALRSHHAPCGAKAARDLGHAPRPLAATIQDAYAWFREQRVIHS